MFNKIVTFFKNRNNIIIKFFIGLLCVPVLDKIVRFLFLFGTFFGSFMRRIFAFTIC